MVQDGVPLECHLFKSLIHFCQFAWQQTLTVTPHKHKHWCQSAPLLCSGSVVSFPEQASFVQFFLQCEKTTQDILLFQFQFQNITRLFGNNAFNIFMSSCVPVGHH